MVGNFAFLFYSRLAGRTSDSMMVPTSKKDFSIDDMAGASVLLLWYSVVCTVKSLSLIYLILIS